MACSSAARAAQSGRAAGAPKGRDGAVEAIRALMVAKRSARAGRTQTINQARALVLTGPDDLRIRFCAHTRRTWSPTSARCAPAHAPRWVAWAGTMARRLAASLNADGKRSPHTRPGAPR